MSRTGRRPNAVVAALLLVVSFVLSACTDSTEDGTPVAATPAMVCAAADGNGKPTAPDVDGQPLSDDIAAKIQDMVKVAEQKGIPEAGQVVAIMVALAEKTLSDLGWVGGFFDVLSKIPGWEHLPLAQVAALVRAVAGTGLFEPFEQLAYQILGYVKQVVCKLSTSGPNPNGAAIVAAAEKYRGTPYVWGGGGFDGPSNGGFDCSGLTQYAYNQVGIRIPRTVDSLWDQVSPIYPPIMDKSQISAGDLLVFQDSSGFKHHIGIALDNNSMIHAPHTGDVVREVKDLWSNSYYNEEFAGALRPTASIPNV